MQSKLDSGQEREKESGFLYVESTIHVYMVQIYETGTCSNSSARVIIESIEIEILFFDMRPNPRIRIPEELYVSGKIRDIR